MANFLKTVGQPLVYKIIQPFILLLVKLGVTPNMITTIGLLLNIFVAAIFIYGGILQPFNLSIVGWAGFGVLFAGLFDMIDGRLARVSNNSSSFGAFYDSVIDRYSELFLFLGICYYLVAHQYLLSALAAFVALIGSIMVSYIRARAEGLGIECSDGLMQRPERILLIGLSALLCGIVYSNVVPFSITFPNTNIVVVEPISIFTIPMFALAILTNFTAWQRLQHCKKMMQKQ
jgi:CDP-diacylglycerol---glycerol-3-phosphate 3-phosphatidyltransferase